MKYYFNRGTLESLEVLKLLWALYHQSQKNGFVVIERIRPTYPVRARDGLEIALIYGAIDEPPADRILATVRAETRWKIDLDEDGVNVEGCSCEFACGLESLVNLRSARKARLNHLADRSMAVFRQLGTWLNMAALTGLGVEWLELLEVSAILLSILYHAWMLTIPLLLWTVTRRILPKQRLQAA